MPLLAPLVCYLWCYLWCYRHAVARLRSLWLHCALLTLFNPFVMLWLMWVVLGGAGAALALAGEGAMLVGATLAGASLAGGRCSYQRAYSMLGAHCSGLNLHSVPASLKNSIEILDVSFNRIRDLRNTTFQRYSSLRYLYMGDNMILSIEAGTFDSLTSLETLDLSMNALSSIPAFILSLPSLRKLYMADNNLSNLSGDLQTVEKPIRAPLAFLSLSNCQLTAFPALGSMPHLEHLNLSSNDFKELLPRHLSGLCGLRSLDLTGSVSSSPPGACSFKSLALWLSEKQISVLPEASAFFNPDSEEARSCPDVQYTEETIAEYAECRQAIRTRKLNKQARKTWLAIASSLGGILVICAICFYCLHLRNVRKTRKHKSRIIEVQNQSNNNKLLNDVS